MGCNGGCNESKVLAKCEVCVLVDGNYTEKEVGFCGLCVAYICEQCWDNPIKRAKAATISGTKAFNEIVKGLFKK